MPKPARKTMNVLRWIFGIPLAVVISLGLMTLVIYSVDEHLRVSNYDLYTFVHAAEIIFSFTLLVFLSCLFAPAPKKYAALFSITIMVILIGIAFYVALTNKSMGDFTMISAASFLSSFTGLFIGLFLSYFTFKNKGWNRELTTPEMPEDY